MKMLRPQTVVAPDFGALLTDIQKLGREVIEPASHAVDADARFPREAIDPLKEMQLMSAYVPEELGGMGLTIIEIGRICETLSQYCASTAMVFAMHQIQ